MALARVKTWIQEALFYQDLNTEFDNIVSHVNTTAKSYLTGHKVLDATIASQNQLQIIIIVIGAVQGDYVTVAPSVWLQTLGMYAYVSAANNVTVTYVNNGASSVALGVHTIHALVEPR